MNFIPFKMVTNCDVLKNLRLKYTRNNLQSFLLKLLLRHWLVFIIFLLHHPFWASQTLVKVFQLVWRWPSKRNLELHRLEAWTFSDHALSGLLPLKFTQRISKGYGISGVEWILLSLEVYLPGYIDRIRITISACTVSRHVCWIGGMKKSEWSGCSESFPFSEMLFVFCWQILPLRNSNGPQGCDNRIPLSGLFGENCLCYFHPYFLNSCEVTSHLLAIISTYMLQLCECLSRVLCNTFNRSLRLILGYCTEV